MSQFRNLFVIICISNNNNNNSMLVIIVPNYDFNWNPSIYVPIFDPLPI